MGELISHWYRVVVPMGQGEDFYLCTCYSIDAAMAVVAALLAAAHQGPSWVRVDVIPAG